MVVPRNLVRTQNALKENLVFFEIRGNTAGEMSLEALIVAHFVSNGPHIHFSLAWFVLFVGNENGSFPLQTSLADFCQ